MFQLPNSIIFKSIDLMKNVETFLLSFWTLLMINTIKEIFR